MGVACNQILISGARVYGGGVGWDGGNKETHDKTPARLNRSASPSSGPRPSCGHSQNTASTVAMIDPAAAAQQRRQRCGQGEVAGPGCRCERPAEVTPRRAGQASSHEPRH
ncbi:hypothetical protein E2C01_054733 [Portunus trituberculatus]|uniref:Uncharacterized protein n=1 Tax=Portunus trituberculatus TaxID=210409 RepID=A0A5B7GU31_PORTR|nr:hypothetical protein [Portunus trituberculatus]